MSTIIKTEDLSKKYIISHQKLKYRQTLLETMTGMARGLYQHVRHPLSPNRQTLDLEEFWALKDINFQIQQGERVGIIGLNGAGKSTLLKILSRITEPTSGRVHIKGRVSSLLEVGTGFHTELSGRENIFLNGAIIGMTRQEIKRKFDEIVDFAEIEKFIDTPVKRYSSGMYVRLAVAVAAHMEPEILIVDEVLALGDTQFQKKCLGKMNDVTNEGRTILFVSHNMGVVQNLCNRVFLLDQGKVACSGETREVISAYLMKNYPSDGDSFSNCLRSGNGKLRIVSFHLESEDRKKLMNATSGEPLVFTIGFECFDDKLSQVSVGISIHTETEYGLMLNYSHFSDMYFSDLPRKGEFKCEIDPCPLAPGNYRVMLRVIARGDEIDWPKVFIPISVVMGDFYSTGHFDNKLVGWGPLLIKGNWTVQ